MSDTTEKRTFPLYEGKLECAAAKGEVKLIIDEDGLLCDGLFSQVFIPYKDIDTLCFRDYSVFVSAKGEVYRFFHMGQETEWFYDHLRAGYNAKVLEVLRVEEAPLLESSGVCDYEGHSARADIAVFSDCLCVLPPDSFARRYPFVFLNGMDTGNYALTLSLSTGERCALSKLGRDLEPLERVITERIHALRKETTDFLSGLCGALGTAERATAARLLPEGIVAPLGALPAALRKTLEDKARNSKMGAYYDSLLSLGGGDTLAMGIEELPEEVVERLKAELIERLSANAEGEVTLTEKQEDALRWMVFAAMPSADGRFAIVEFAFPDEDAATYLFRLGGSFGAFLPLLNRALEASEFRREVFSSPEQKLSDEARMLAARTPAIAALRGLYAGKAAHRSPASWRASIVALMEG